MPPFLATEDTIPHTHDESMNANVLYMKKSSSSFSACMYSLLQSIHLLPIVREFFDCLIRLWITDHVKQYPRRSRDIMRTGKQSTYRLGGRLYTGGKNSGGEALAVQPFRHFPHALTCIHPPPPQ